VSRAAALLLIAALALGACFGRGQHRAPPKDPLYSPNGEPLSGGPLGHPSCQEAMGRWFDRVDTGHRGVIEFQEFIADARRQFAAMDLAKDGVVTPSELAQYRAPYDADTPASAAGGRAPDAAGAPRHAQGSSSGDDDDKAITEDRPDPVMLADVTLRNRVTLPDFLAYARRNFIELDTDHDGRLVKSNLLKSCGKNGGS